jgi:hypothetical protein
MAAKTKAEDTIGCMVHPNVVTKRYAGDYETYNQVRFRRAPPALSGRRRLRACERTHHRVIVSSRPGEGGRESASKSLCAVCVCVCVCVCVRA